MATNDESAPYAYEDDWVTCENGHKICRFNKTVYVGERQDVETQIVDWTQPAPEIGSEQDQLCAKCQAPFWSKQLFHFENGWRGLGGKFEPLDMPSVSRETKGQ